MVVVGFTVYVKVRVVEPAQVALLAVTTTVAITAAVVLFVAVNTAILPVPFAARPILVVLLVQVYEVTLEPVKVMAEVLAPLQTVWLDTAFTVGAAFTVIVKALEVAVLLEIQEPPEIVIRHEI